MTDPTPVPLTRAGDDRLSALGGLVARAGRTARQFAAEAGVSLVTASSLCRGNYAARQDRILQAVAEWLRRVYPCQYVIGANDVRDLVLCLPRGRIAMQMTINKFLERKGHRPTT